jgi:hypothetical protein
MAPPRPDRSDAWRGDDGDELVTGRLLPRRLRPVTAVVIAAVVAALLVVAVATRRHHPSAAPEAPPTSPAAHHALPAAPVAAVPVPARGRPDDVLTVGNVTWFVAGRSLLRTRAGGSLRRHVGAPAAAGAHRRLLFDPQTLTLWLVDIGGSHPALVCAFAALTLRPVLRIRWPRAVTTAVPVRGSLYLADRGGLERLTTDGARTHIDVPWGRRIRALTADESRDRTLAIVGRPGHLRLAQLGELQLFRPVPAPAGLRAATLGVTGDGQVWLAGATPSGALLDRLDAGTLRPVRRSRLAAQLGRRAVLLAGGTSAVLVTGMRAVRAAPQLWCVTSGGRPVRRWQLAATRAAMTRGHAVAITRAAVLSLGLHAPCGG